MNSRLTLAPPRNDRGARALRGLLSMTLGLMGAACGGGGGGDSAPVAAPSAPTVAAPTGPMPLSALTLGSQVPESYRPVLSVPDTVLKEAHAKLPPAKGPSYLQLWVVLPGESGPSVLWIGRWAPGSLLPRVQVPLAVNAVSFELYNAAGSVSGRWSL